MSSSIFRLDSVPKLSAHVDSHLLVNHVWISMHRNVLSAFVANLLYSLQGGIHKMT